MTGIHELTSVLPLGSGLVLAALTRQRRARPARMTAGDSMKTPIPKSARLDGSGTKAIVSVSFAESIALIFTRLGSLG